MNNSTTNRNKKSKHLNNFDPQKAGIDIGASSIFVCALNKEGKQEVREYPTFTRDLVKMSDWLKERGVESVAMESTGVYWIPVFEILELKGFETLLVNAHYLKNVPGRKTDVKDCQWIHQLHSHGLLNGSFRPSDEFVQLRAYVRQRKQIFERAAIQVQLMHKALTQMNIQLNFVLSDITGQTGLSIIQAILRGERNPKSLASYRHERCKKSEKEIAKALEGNWRDEHLFALKQSYDAYEFHHKQIVDCEKQIQKLLEKITPNNSDASNQRETSDNKAQSPVKKTRMKTSYNRSPYSFNASWSLTRLCGVNLTEIPGIDANTAMTIVSEIGTDMSKWKSEKHFASWLGLCPGNKISGGKVLSSRTKPTNNRAAQAFRLAANSLFRSKTALGGFFRRMRSKLGAPKAITAAAHKLCRILYRMLKDGVSYKEMGEDYYEHMYRERVLANLKRRAQDLGFDLISCEAVPKTL